MPAYEYHCVRCGDFEVRRHMNEPALEACPNCAGPITRVFTRNVNFLFKGSGFYTTDYRDESYKKDAAADSASAQAKPEIKAAAKPETAPAVATSPVAKHAPSSPAPAGGDKPA
jgi:putative FmdB family regulatory protein